MIEIKQLINPNILDNEWEGFFGDSEYIAEDGSLKLGYWTLCKVLDAKMLNGIYYTINDKIDESQLTGNNYFKILNSNNNLCFVKLVYDGEWIKMKEGRININVARSTRNKLAELGKKDDTFNDIILKLIQFYEDNKS